MAFQQSDRTTTAGLLGRGSLLLAGTQQTDFAIRSAPHSSNLILGVGVTERLRIQPDGKVGINTTTISQQLTIFTTSGYALLAQGPSNGIGLGNNGAIVFGNKTDVGCCPTTDERSKR